MQFSLKLYGQQGALIPINYQYPLSAIIYRILETADSSYARFLHDTGYRQKEGQKSFKLFTFSDIRVPFSIRGDRLQLKAPEAAVTVSFHLPQAAENFIRGLFMNQQIEIADKRSRASFNIGQVEALPSGLSGEEVQEILLQPLSPVVCGKKNERRKYNFLSPEEPEFVFQLMHNWKEKYKTIYEDAETGFEDSGMEVVFYANPSRSRLLTIKADSDEETKIRGFVNFRLKVRGKREALELLINSGAGLYNAQGMGCLGLAK
jgi:CRISPR-associated endoribonuclease Cas6